MEKKMETTIMGYIGLERKFWFYGDNGKANGNYYGIRGYIGVIFGFLKTCMPFS